MVGEHRGHNEKQEKLTQQAACDAILQQPVGSEQTRAKDEDVITRDPPERRLIDLAQIPERD